MRFIRLAHGRLLLKGTWVLAGWLFGWLARVLSATDLERTSFKMRRILSSPAWGRRPRRSRSPFILHLVPIWRSLSCFRRDSSLVVTSHWAKAPLTFLERWQWLSGSGGTAVSEAKEEKGCNTMGWFHDVDKSENAQSKKNKQLKRNIKVPSSFQSLCFPVLRVTH